MPPAMVRVLFETNLAPFAHGQPVGRLRIACERVVAYFRHQWLNSVPPTYWSKFGLVGHRTTNLAEGYHNDLASVYPASHPTLREYLKVHQQEHAGQLNRILQLQAGKPSRPRRRRYIQLNDRLLQSQADFTQLLNIAHEHAPWQVSQMCIEQLDRIEHLLADT